MCQIQTIRFIKLDHCINKTDFLDSFQWAGENGFTPIQLSLQDRLIGPYPLQCVLSTVKLEDSQIAWFKHTISKQAKLNRIMQENRLLSSVNSDINIKHFGKFPTDCHQNSNSFSTEIRFFHVQLERESPSLSPLNLHFTIVVPLKFVCYIEVYWTSFFAHYKLDHKFEINFFLWGNSSNEKTKNLIRCA